MTWVTGPNGVVAGVSDDVAKSIVGDGSRGYTIVPEPTAKTDEPKKPAPRKRATRAKTDAE